METEGVVWLRKIQDGSISEYLTEYSELKEMRLTDLRRKVEYTIIDLNKKSLFPKRRILKSLMNIHQETLQVSIEYLKKYVLMIDVTIPELLNVFEIHKGRRPNLPQQLDYATYYDLSRMRQRSGRSHVNWHERKQNPRSLHYPRYYIALVSENGIPVFSKAFSFLEHYKL